MCLELMFINMLVDEFYFDKRQDKSSVLLHRCWMNRVLFKIVLTEEFWKFSNLKDMKFRYIYGNNG